MPISPPTDPFATVEAPAPGDQQRWLCHLLRRAGFGPSHELLTELAGKSLAEAAAAMLDFDPAEDQFNPVLDQLEGFVFPFDRIEAAQAWWVFRMVNTRRPLEERMALFWHNHFATSAGKVGNPNYMHAQIELFRRLGLKNFRDLLIEIGKDPAMLIWLDGQTNHKGHANENYGREVMELFTLGIGNYSEQDIKELARAFTGWQVKDGAGVFDPKLHDDGDKEVFGSKGKLDAEGAVDLLLAQPAASRHLARKLLRTFVHPAPLEAHVDHYAQRLVEHKWEIRPVLGEMLASRLFFSDWAYRAKIKSPCEFIIGAVLAIGGTVNTAYIREAMTKMGQTLLAPPSVKGWDGEEAWINANTIVQRFNVGLALASQRRNEMARKSDLQGWLEKRKLTTAAAILDHFSLLLIDGALPPEMRDQLLAYMNKDTKNKPKDFVFDAPSVDAKVRGIIHLLTTTPEFSLA